MPVTTLDPNTALIIIDLQKGILSYSTVRPIGEVVKHTNSVSRIFPRLGETGTTAEIIGLLDRSRA
jgi:hypothetical protein